MSTNGAYDDDEIHHYDDIEDEESVEKNIFQRHQSDSVSLSNSLFTAADHLEEEEKDTSSTENERHEYLPTQHQDSINQQNESINALIKTLNVQTSIVWQGIFINIYHYAQILIIPLFSDYRPQYHLLNQSYDDVKKGKCITNELHIKRLTVLFIEIYKEIYSTMEKIQALDHKFNKTKIGFQLEVENECIQMSNKLLSQCKELSKEKEYVKLNTEQGEKR